MNYMILFWYRRFWWCLATWLWLNFCLVEIDLEEIWAQEKENSLKCLNLSIKKCSNMSVMVKRAENWAFLGYFRACSSIFVCSSAWDQKDLHNGPKSSSNIPQGCRKKSQHKSVLSFMTKSRIFPGPLDKR